MTLDMLYPSRLQETGVHIRDVTCAHRLQETWMLHQGYIHRLQETWMSHQRYTHRLQETWMSHQRYTHRLKETWMSHQKCHIHIGCRKHGCHTRDVTSTQATGNTDVTLEMSHPHRLQETGVSHYIQADQPYPNFLLISLCNYVFQSIYGPRIKPRIKLNKLKQL